MSISENVGGMSKYLNNIRTADKYLDMKEGIYNSLMESKLGEPIVSSIRRAKSSVKQLVIPGMFFEDMGITYLGPVDGHNINAMMKVFREAKRCKSAVLVHVLTQKARDLPQQRSIRRDFTAQNLLMSRQGCRFRPRPSPAIRMYFQL